MRAKIRLETLTDVRKFVDAVTGLNGKITITDASNLRVNAKSIFGVLCALEFDDVWVESENDIYSHISDFVVIE